MNRDKEISETMWFPSTQVCATWNITPKIYYNFQSVPCEMVIHVRRLFRKSMPVATPPPQKKKDSTINKLSYSQNVNSTLFFYIHCQSWGTYHSGVPTFVSPHHRRLPPVCSASFPPLISTPCHLWSSAMLGKLQGGGTSESDKGQVQTVQWMVKQFPLELPEQLDCAHSSVGSRCHATTRHPKLVGHIVCFKSPRLF